MVGLNRMIFTATGKYLEVSDLTDKKTQSLYAIVDNGTEVTDPRDLAKRTLVDDDREQETDADQRQQGPGAGMVRRFSGCGSRGGGSERNNVDMILAVGTLVVPTNVPTQEICDAGGYSWINFLNYATGETVGGATTSTAGILFNADLTTGINAVWIGSTPRSFAPATASAPARVHGIPFAGVTSGVKGHRVGWREIFTK